MMLSSPLAVMQPAAEAAAASPWEIAPWPMLLLAAATLAWLSLAIWAMTSRYRLARRAREARREAAFYRALASAAPGGFLVLSDGGDCLAGGAVPAWLGLAQDRFNREELLETIVSEIFDPPAATAFRRLLSDPAADGPVELATRRGKVLAAWRCSGFSPSVTLLWFEDRTMAHEDSERRKEYRESMARALDGLRAVLEAAPFPIWLRDESLDLIAVNGAYVEAVEAESEAEVLERQIELVSNALTGDTRDTARRTREAAGIVTERHFAIVKGQRRALLVTDVAIDNKIAGFAVDVTEAEEARAEISRVVEAHAETLNRLSSPVAVFDSEQRLQFFNRAFARLFRLSEDRLAEQPDHASLLETLRERRRLPEQADFRAWKARQLDLHKSLEPVEEMWHLPDGSTLRMVAQPHPLGGLLVLFEDVTDRLALEGSYNTLIAVQRETLNNLHEAVAVFGSDARLKLYNPAYAQIWELDTDFLDGEPHFGEMLEQSRRMMYTGGNWEALKSRLLAQISGRVVQSGRWHRADGRVLDYAIVPLPDGRTLTTHVDVTDSVRIERALRERNEALETADRLKSEFVASMSYELRTPLNSIVGFGQLLESGLAGPLAPKQGDYIGYVLEAAEQLRDLIDDILDLAVIEAGAMTLDVRQVSVADLVDSTVAVARELARKGNLRLLTEIASDCGAVEGDDRRLRQALYNLVTNAIRFTPPGGTVTIRAERRGDDQVAFEVSDTGVGISLEEKEKVFEKFHSGADPSSRKGVGLGLSLVQSFVELHSGTVDIESRPGEGTTVTCILPRKQGDKTAIREAV